MNAAKRSLQFVLSNLRQMEHNNERLRSQPRFRGYRFEEMPDPWDVPENIVRPGTVSIFYLAGYDHLNQSAIVSIVLEALFGHRSTLSGLIPPFQAVIEEAHNFILSRQEGTDETPSLPTIRKVITEGRRFGTGLVLISQRPSRLDETTLAQCNSFSGAAPCQSARQEFRALGDGEPLRLRRQYSSNFRARPGNRLRPGRALPAAGIKVRFDADLVSQAIGDEDFIAEAVAWNPDTRRAANADTVRRHAAPAPRPAAPTTHHDSEQPTQTPASIRNKPVGRRGRIHPEGY